MLYDTKGEFIQALKDYDTYYENAMTWRQRYRDLHYLRYEKIKSPLDYEIVGYKDNEVIRQIKSRGNYNPDLANSNNEKLENEMLKCEEEFSRYYKKMTNVMAELHSIHEPLRTILQYRYLQHLKLKVICQKTDLNLDEAGLYKYIMRGLDRYYNK